MRTLKQQLEFLRRGAWGRRGRTEVLLEALKRAAWLNKAPDDLVGDPWGRP